MIPNPWLVRGGVLLGVAGVILLTTVTVNTGAAPTAYAQASPEGVLMPEVKEIPKVEKPQDNEEDTAKPEEFERRIAFRVPDSEIDPLSFLSLTKDVSVHIVNVKPITETTRDARGKSIMLLMDNSYSMVQPSPPSPWNADWLPAADKDYKRIDAVKALLEVLNPEDRVALATFPRINPMPGYRIPRLEPPAILKNFSKPMEILPVLGELKGNENSGTPLYRVIGDSVEWLAKENSDRPKIAVLLTDGRDTGSGRGIPEGLVEKVKASGITLIALALGPAPDLDALKLFATEVIPVSESDQLVPAFRRLAEKLKTINIGYEVELDLKRPGKAFDDDENVVVGFRAKKSPKRMTVRVGGNATPPPLAPTPNTPAGATTKK
ncbi:MAG: vWA domain-containing protein [Fimbriimonadaceae bacterium]